MNYLQLRNFFHVWEYWFPFVRYAIRNNIKRLAENGPLCTLYLGVVIDVQPFMAKILVVDDDVDLLHMVKLFLQINDYIVKAISRWEDIQSSVNSFTPDLILLDITLEGADGRVICKQLKMAEDTQHIPILLFSAKNNLKQTFSDYLADGFVAKPFEPSNLINKIRSIFSDGSKTRN